MDPEAFNVLGEIFPAEISTIISRALLELHKKPEATLIKECKIQRLNSAPQHNISASHLKLNEQKDFLIYHICTVCGDIMTDFTNNIPRQKSTLIERQKLSPSHYSGKACYLFFRKNEKEAYRKWTRKLLTSCQRSSRGRSLR
nr:hypothetical protein K-LCC10_0045 [Kaumoebavirus]